MRRIWAVVLVAAWLWAGPAGAQEPAKGGASSPTDVKASAPKVDPLEVLKEANKLAGRGKFAQAIPKYRQVLEEADGAFPGAYFNLAEVHKAKGECKYAGFYYQLYGLVSEDEGARQEAQKGVEACRKGASWPTLEIAVTPQDGATLKLNGIYVSADSSLPATPLPPGDYEISVTVRDHHPFTGRLALREGGAERIEAKLDKMTFFGHIGVKPSVPGARVRIFAGPSDETEVLFDGKAPFEPVKVKEGRHFVEVTAKGYRRWIRNVSVSRDDEVEVDVTLRMSTEELN